MTLVQATEFELAAFCDQGILLVEGLGHQPNDETQFVLHTGCDGDKDGTEIVEVANK